MYDISVSTMCIYCDYCVYHYKSTELISLYTLDIGLKINIIIIIISMHIANILPYNLLQYITNIVPVLKIQQYYVITCHI